ncbi:MAG: endonuclease Q family protein [Candidatus Cloacimonadales bacterium]|jgi:PHP family Zn ribbon phosphoesterase|nr:endonuclease Q family protein [Candidatus Cloacimonadota bacterium]MDD2649797.1 endonuclease Q family protein [Candidatus Cloacimonadota bacterium]MDD3501933.1 endonuclease Q family protein [Candidatus Cloacimonadota bacterium]MDX9977482.1 endonuclease Q family protein [Candidatus Cloacimonadales bacterium]
MQLCVDLHSHSGYAGGVGDIQLNDIVNTMSYKGIDVFGTGDCLYPKRTHELYQELKYENNQLYRLKKDDKQSFLLQTEVIFSVKLEAYTHKIVAHHIIFFPNFKAIEQMSKLMNKWQQKNTIGRPFIVCRSQIELEDRLFEIQSIDSMIEIIPAHIMTPEGLMGGKNKLTSMKEFYGNFLPNIHAIETGLSADPAMLSKLDGINLLAMLSFSDCHSAALNRVGREFTVLECKDYSYASIIESIRQKRIIYTAEFNPAEGRYYLTGHRAGKNNHIEDTYFLNDAPHDLICPICNKKLIIGVRDRCKMLKQSCAPKQNFIHLIPLIDVLAYANGIKSVNSKRVITKYKEIIKHFATEINLWQSTDNIIENSLKEICSNDELYSIIAVKNQKFTYNPPGFDGLYGKLEINNKGVALCL